MVAEFNARSRQQAVAACAIHKLDSECAASRITLKNETHPDRPLPHPVPERDQTAALVTTVPGEEKGVERVRVRFIGFRVRPLDPDNFSGSCKDCIDFLRHAHLIPGDEPWRIILETEQVRVKTFREEKTVIEIDDTNPT